MKTNQFLRLDFHLKALCRGGSLGQVAFGRGAAGDDLAEEVEEVVNDGLFAV